MEPVIIAVRRKARRSEKFLRALMPALAVLFLLEGIMFSTGFMLPCMLMTLACFWYYHASRREYEYTFQDDWLRIERVSDRGRRVLHEFPLADVTALARPDDPAVAKYRKGGGEKIKKFDYTSYEDDVPYYTMIVEQNGAKVKFLLDLTPDAIAWVRHANRSAVLV